MNKKRIKKYLLILVILAIIIMSCILVILKNNQGKEIIIYNNIDEIANLETLINEIYGKYISQVPSEDKSFIYDINVKLKYDLIQDGKSEKYFYDRLIENVANKVQYTNFRIIDTKKELTIRVICDHEKMEVIRYDINGDPNFYGHYESMQNLANYTKTKETGLEIQSKEIQTLISNEWLTASLNLGKDSSKTDKYNLYLNKGLQTYTINKKIFNIIFCDKYAENVVNNIKVGESLENVIKILGEPTFGNIEEQYIGYKGKDIYVFFSKGQISVYKVEKNIESDKLVELSKNYETDGNVKSLVSSLTDKWVDYEKYNYTANAVELTYPLIGIKVEFGITTNHGITIYNNYIGKVLENYTLEGLKNTQIEIPNHIYFTAKDSIDEYEYNRIKQMLSLTEGDFEEPDDIYNA